MFYAYKLLGSLIVPPGLLVIITALFSCLLLRTKSKKKLSGSMLLFSLLIWFMSTSVGSYAITGRLERKYENSLPLTERPTAFLVLAGGSNYDREGRESMPGVYSLERIYTAVTAADPNKDVLISGGVPATARRVRRSRAAGLRHHARHDRPVSRVIAE